MLIADGSLAAVDHRETELFTAYGEKFRADEDIPRSLERIRRAAEEFLKLKNTEAHKFWRMECEDKTPMLPTPDSSRRRKREL